MKKNRKILLAGGCSLTEHTLVSWEDSSICTDFPRWPEVLAKKLDMECVNLGRSGWSNQLISTSIFEYLMENPKKEIGLVCCLWTDYTRTSLYNMPDWPAIVVKQLFVGFLKKVNDSADARNAELYKEVENISDKINMWTIGPDKFLDLIYYYTKNTNTKAETIVENIIKNTIKIFHDLECMLSLRNIPHLYLQGLFPFYYRHQLGYNRELEKIYAPPIEQLLFYLLKYENWFDKTKFIGWPGFKSGSGHGIFFDKKETAKYFISKEDRHPNENGHRIIANHFYKKTEELYPHLFKKETNE
jgi:hypothetical protein